MKMKQSGMFVDTADSLAIKTSDHEIMLHI